MNEMFPMEDWNVSLELNGRSRSYVNECVKQICKNRKF